MENKEPLLSICIPTNGIVEWVGPVIDSIYAQGVDNSLFEVVITDNGCKSELAETVKKYNHENLRYYRTSSQGFTNQIDAFEKCNGVFCKMLNHRSKMNPGSIEAILEIVRAHQDKKPIMYFAEGHAEGGEYIECTNTDEFVRRLGIWTSWSCGTGAWKQDLKDLSRKKVDTMFPHTFFLFELREETDYFIWNGEYEVMASDSGKGGYDLFQTFGVGFLDILTGLRTRKRISMDTFIGVKKELLSFLEELFLKEAVLPTKHTFIIGDVCKSICVYYSKIAYYKMVLKAWLKAPFCYVKRILKKRYPSAPHA